MIEEYTSNLAHGMGITLSRVHLVNGRLLGCHDAHLLYIFTPEHRASSILHRDDLSQLESGLDCDRLEQNIRLTLSQLKMQYEA
jgi:hypothetical protein